MEDEDYEYEPRRELNRWLATLLTAAAGIIGGALGILTPLSWVYALAAIQGSNPSALILYPLVLGFSIFTGPGGAALGGWVAGRYIDKYEGRTPTLKFRDNRAGGAATKFCKVLVWLALLFLIGAPFLITSRLKLLQP